MSKVVVVPVTGAQNLSAINENFQTLADTLNNRVFFRDNPVGEPNQVITDVDMNGQRIYNLPQPISPSEPVRYQDLGDITVLTDAAREYADAAELSNHEATLRALEALASANLASTSATNAANSATLASNSADSAGLSAIEAANSATAAEDAASRADRVPQTSATGAAIIPEGTELERPSPLPATGLLFRGNTVTGVPEWYDRVNSVWKKLDGGTGELFEYSWHNGPRSSIDSGKVATDGQQLLLLTHPDVCQAIWDGKQYAVSEAVWQSDPTKRNCWSTGDGTSWVRVPDLNAAVAGTGKPFYLRGGPSELGGTSVGDAIRNITGSVSRASDTGLLLASSPVTGAFKVGTTSKPNATNAVATTGYDLGFDASLTVPTADENRVKTAYGVLTVRVFTEISNVGALDAGQLATQLSIVDAQLQTLDSDIDFTFIYPNGGNSTTPATIVSNSRYISANPFPGYNVLTEVQIKTTGNWFSPGWSSNNTNAFGTTAGLDGNDIVVQTGTSGVTAANALTGASAVVGTAPTSAQVRVKVWKLRG